MNTGTLTKDQRAAYEAALVRQRLLRFTEAVLAESAAGALTSRRLQAEALEIVRLLRAE